VVTAACVFLLQAGHGALSCFEGGRFESSGAIVLRERGRTSPEVQKCPVMITRSTSVAIATC
jgi:hypothetical protein